MPGSGFVQLRHSPARAGRAAPARVRQRIDTGADRNAQPSAPQRVAHVVRAPPLLRQPQDETEHERRRKPPPGGTRGMPVQREPATRVGERRGRVPCRKAPAGTAIVDTPAPMRHMACDAAERLGFEKIVNETLDKPRRLKLQLAAPAPKAAPTLPSF